MTTKTNRADTIDLLRGFIMMAMALDHASAMIGRVHFSELWGVPFKGYPDYGWWFTRFISHLCAPGFFFLMGMSVFLFAQKRMESSWEEARIRRYFFKRGGIILLLMFFVEFPAWAISMILNQSPKEEMIMPGMETTFLIPTSVLYGLATCMMLGGLLWKLKPWQLLSISLSSFALSWWYITYSNPREAFLAIEHFLIVPGRSFGAFVIYPIIPWIGITTLGILWAKLLKSIPRKIYPLSLVTGISFILIFVLIRYFDYGNFSISDNDDWISFFTLVKYPPSIAFALITCGINLVLFFVFSLLNNQKWLYPVKVFGQTAMFFYLAHLYLYAIIGSLFPTGCDIRIMYILWALGLVILYFICNWFLNFKKTKPNNSLWRMI